MRAFMPWVEELNEVPVRGRWVMEMGDGDVRTGWL